MVANAFSEMCDDIQSVLRKPDTTRIGKFEPYTSELRPDEPLAHTASRSKTSCTSLWWPSDTPPIGRGAPPQ